MTRNHLWVLATGVVLGMPVLWALGLDQPAWIAAALLLGAAWWRSNAFRRVTAAAGGLTLVVIVSGLLGAQGERWATLAREIVIVGAFFVVVLAIACGGLTRSLQRVTAAVVAIVGISSTLSLVAFVTQEPFRFTTVIAPLVPPFVATTGLGFQSFVERSLAETSFFLGREFMRPQGLFLFSTSQAVSQAVAIPLAVLVARWFPRFRHLTLIALAVTFVALVVSTSRTAIVALAIAAGAVWLTEQIRAGEVRVAIPLRGPRASITWGVAAFLIALTALLGVLEPLGNLVATRSFEGRSGLYEMTVDAWTEQPLIGHGTEVDWTPTPQPSPTPTPAQTAEPTPSSTPTPSPIPGSDEGLPRIQPELPPLGSHSWYLGVLFKQGLIGLAVLLLFIGSVAHEIAKAWRRRVTAIQPVAVAALAVLMVGALESVWLDPATAFVAAIPVGLGLAMARLPPRGSD